VSTVGSIENLSAVREALQRQAGEVDVLLINIARGTQQLESMRFGALNPTFLLSAAKAK
jgi:precorrin-6Y C5,15-methyltransferase (decarboxylating)